MVNFNSDEGELTAKDRAKLRRQLSGVEDDEEEPEENTDPTEIT